MNVHTKLFLSMVKIIEIYLKENGYEYNNLSVYDKSCFSKQQFKEMIDLANSDLTDQKNYNM